MATMDANEVLKILLEQGIVDSDSLRQAELMQLEKKVLLLHDYKISQLPNGQWKTYLPLEKGRKELRAKSKEAILNKILAFYEEEETNPQHLENITFEKLFDEWLEYKSTITESPNTIKRHLNHYNKYLGGLAVKNVNVRSIDYLSIQALCNSIVKENNLTRKEWTNVKTILKGMFEYAFEKGYINTNIMDRVRITVRYRQEVRKKSSTETFNSFEYKQIMTYLDEKISENSHPGFFAIKINFFLGLRVGELVALKWSDIDGNMLHIEREEIRDQEHNKTYVVNHTKTNRDRYVPIIPEALALFYKLYKYNSPKEEDYIFVRNGERITSQSVNYLLRKYAKDKGIDVKSSHKIRKTFASRLEAGGVPMEAIRDLLGHSNLMTTMSYVFNPLTDVETTQKISDALLRI